jgi:hypothetical protein
MVAGLAGAAGCARERVEYKVTKCFLTTPTLRAALYLRRYVGSSTCSGPMSYHDNMNYLGEFPVNMIENDCWNVDEPNIHHDDPRWPTHCTCGYAFASTDERQYHSDHIYTDGVNSWPHRQLPVGAMYYADWYFKSLYWDNMEGDPLMVITPGGEWNTDSRASNCTMPNDRLHRCWVKHGEPPNLHIDKAGHTCAAGAGSILCGKYHGFLHNGHLT